MPALIVNDETITDLEVAQARRSSPIFTVVQEGPVAEDLERLLVDSLIRQEVLAQAASRMRIGNGEVRDELAAFRERNGVAGSGNDEAYLRLIGGAGYTDATFRDYLRDQLQVAAFQDEVTEGIDVDEAEVEAFYDVNSDAYRSDPRVLARQIVVDDAETAEALRVRALAGESFAELAAEASLERAEQDGAVGGETPQPVGRPAFPSVVADAVFARSTPGLTPVVESGGRAYLVQVEEIVPAAPLPLDEVREEVREDALGAKRQAALDDRIEQLVAEAEVSVAEGSELSLDDPLVATVGQAEIHASELARETYTNPQIQQALSPQTASLIAEFFKPSILEQLVDRELAVQGSEDLDATFFGTDALIAQSALNWIARDAEASESDIQAFYQANLDRYTVAASADVLRVDFGDAAAAAEYRDALLNGADPETAAENAGGEVDDVGVVRQGQMAAPLDTALFSTDAFEDLPDDPRAVSDVLVLDVPVEEEPAQDEATPDEAATDEAATDEARRHRTETRRPTRLPARLRPPKLQRMPRKRKTPRVSRPTLNRPLNPTRVRTLPPMPTPARRRTWCWSRSARRSGCARWRRCGATSRRRCSRRSVSRFSASGWTGFARRSMSRRCSPRPLRRPPRRRVRSTARPMTGRTAQ
ncbi:MAG: peptidyl-prolyl cis-trans isomerase [Trueperaceae bacterium]|nr:peptidyl-prolyl cis-trans isomerase [Trueperaceae bacterium]